MRNSSITTDTRERILDSARRLLERYGYRKMTVDDIAHEAGIGKGTIYLFFPSKEEIALSCMDRSYECLKMELARLASSDLPSPERVRQFLILRVMYRFDTVQNFSESLDEVFAALRTSFLKRRDGYQHCEAVILAEILSDGQNAGEFDFDDGFETAQSLLVATNSLMPYSLSVQQLGDREKVEARVRHIVDLALNGLIRRR